MLKTVLLLTAAANLFAQTEPQTLAALRFTEIAVGTGAPAAAGKKLTVHYTGWLTDGTKFDSSVDRKEPLTFVQGRRQVIVGWDIGFEGMKVGGKRKLYIPYQLAYGDQGVGPIPPKAELIFDVELLDVADAPTTPPGIDVLVPYEGLEAKVTELASSLPPEKFAKLAPIFLRIANLNQSFLEAAEADTAEISELKPDDTIEARDKILDLMAQSFAAVHKNLETARAGHLGGDAVLFGKPTTRRGLFAALDEAIGEQYGQALALRNN
jgi:hypothetical protein